MSGAGQERGSHALEVGSEWGRRGSCAPEVGWGGVRQDEEGELCSGGGGGEWGRAGEGKPHSGGEG